MNGARAYAQAAKRSTSLPRINQATTMSHSVINPFAAARNTLRRALAALATLVVLAAPLPAAPVALAASDVAAPVLAWYYPQFSQGLAIDIRNAAAARIDALIVSETGAR